MSVFGLEIPNLDCLDPDELAQLHNVFGALSSYCAAKKQAFDAHARGFIQEAQQMEAVCDTIYKNLIPADLKW